MATETTEEHGKTNKYISANPGQVCHSRSIQVMPCLNFLNLYSVFFRGY